MPGPRVVGYATGHDSGDRWGAFMSTAWWVRMTLATVVGYWDKKGTKALMLLVLVVVAAPTVMVSPAKAKSITTPPGGYYDAGTGSDTNAQDNSDTEIFEAGSGPNPSPSFSGLFELPGDDGKWPKLKGKSFYLVLHEHQFIHVYRWHVYL